MDINLKVKIEAPELMAALLAIAEALPQLNIGGRLVQGDVVQAVEAVSTAAGPANEIKKVSLEQVKASIESLSRAGKVAEAKELLAKFKAKKVSQLAEKDYEAVVREAKFIN